MGFWPFYGKGPHLLLGAGLHTACGKITVNSIPKGLDNYVIFTVYTRFTNVAAGHIIKPGGPKAGDPWCSALRLHHKHSGQMSAL